MGKQQEIFVEHGQMPIFLLGVISKLGECSFRHKRAGSKGQNSKRSMQHVICNQGAASTIFVSKKATASCQECGIQK